MITDHKTLVSLFKKSFTSASPRLSRMLLCILDYQLDVMYQPGTKVTNHNDNSKASVISGLGILVHDGEVSQDKESN